MSAGNEWRLCRTCARDCQQGTPLWTSCGLLPSPALMLTHCTRLTIGSDDSFPKRICNKCLEILKKAYDFNEKAFEAQKAFENILKNNSQPSQTSDSKDPISDGIVSEITESNSKDFADKSFNQSKHRKKRHKEDCSGAEESKINSKLKKISVPKDIKEIRILPKLTSDNNKTPVILYNRNTDVSTPIIGDFVVEPQTNNTITAISKSSSSDFAPKELRLLDDHWSGPTSGHVCRTCGKQFISSKCLAVHIEKSHMEFTPMRNCSTCNVQFKSPAELTRHNLEVHFPMADPNWRVMCSICKKVYKHKYLLARHKKKVHSQTKDTKHSCDKCGKIFSTNSEFQTHQKYKCSKTPSANADGNEVSCKLCKRSFSSLKNLSLHMKSHVDNLCKYCNRGFTTEEFLLEHITTHTENENPFFCLCCNKSFSMKKALQKHYRTRHSTLREFFFCGHCSRTTFFNINELREHLHSTHADDIFSNKVGNCEVDEQMCELILQTPADIEHSYLSLETDEIEKNEENTLSADQNIEITRKDKYIMISYVDTTTNIFEASIEGLSENISNNRCKIIKTVSQSDDREKLKSIAQKNETPLENESALMKSLLINNSDANFLNKSNESNSSLISILKDSKLPHFELKDCTLPKVDVADLKIISSECPEINYDRNFKAKTQNGASQRSILKANTAGSDGDDIQNKAKNEVSSTTLSPETTKNEMLQCKICAKKFQRMFNLQKHMLVHKSEPPNCIGCNFVAKDHNALSEHLRDCQLLRSSGNLVCPTCGKKLTTAAGLRYHLETHSSIRKYLCTLCQRRFLTMSNLRAHTQTIHSRNRPHVCKSCPRSFATLDHLHKHTTAVHACRRDHVCHYCSRRFMQSSHLTQHMWIHTGVKPHNCPHCPNKYTAKCSLTKHLQRNHWELEHKKWLANEQLYKEQLSKEDNDKCTNFEAVLESDNLELDINNLSESGIVIDGIVDSFEESVNVVIVVKDESFDNII